MYSEKIQLKVRSMFDDLRSDASKIITRSDAGNQAIEEIASLVASETSTRSETILSDMLSELSEETLKKSAFSDAGNRNVFHKADLRQEIFGKYKFTSDASVDYQEAVRLVRSLKVGGTTMAVGGVGAIGVMLIKGLPLSSLGPIPVSVIVLASLGMALADYCVIEPGRSKKDFQAAVDKYLGETQQQFLNWFDEIERYYNQCVDEITKAL